MDKASWEILIYDQDEIMRATKSEPLLFCSKIPVLVLAPSTGKPPPPSRKASIVLRARDHGIATLSSLSHQHLPWFQHLPIIDCLGRSRLCARGQHQSRANPGSFAGTLRCHSEMEATSSECLWQRGWNGDNSRTQKNAVRKIVYVGGTLSILDTYNFSLVSWIALAKKSHIFFI